MLAAKIDVISTLNIQHIESLAPTVRAITGITVRETVPDWVPLSASETVMVDLTPEALQNRMKRGDVYSQEKVEQSLKNFFRRGNLIALRELALRQVAEQVDRSLESYMDAKDIRQNWGVRETNCRVRLREPCRPISDCASGAHGAKDGCGVVRVARPAGICPTRRKSQNSGSKSEICGKSGSAGGEAERTKRGRHDRGICAEQARDTSYFRPCARSAIGGNISIYRRYIDSCGNRRLWMYTSLRKNRKKKSDASAHRDVRRILPQIEKDPLPCNPA